jgi:hypothetical protein
MRQRLKASLLVLVTSAALVVGLASPAHAVASCNPQISGNVYYFVPYASTGYGPVAHGIEIHPNFPSYPLARAGFYSGITGGFSATTGWIPISGNPYPNYSATYEWSSDGSGSYLTCVWRTVWTGYGPVAYGSQYRDPGQIRWGNLNYNADLFYPSGGWMSTA